MRISLREILGDFLQVKWKKGKILVAAREVHEEVGIRLNPADLQEVVKIYIQLEDVGYVFHTFQIRLQKPATVTLEPDAHTEARWLNIQQAIELQLIIGAKEILEYYQTSAL